MEEVKNERNFQNIKNDLLRDKKIFSLFKSSNQIKEKLLDNNKWRKDFLKDGLPDNELVLECIESIIIRDKEVIDEIYVEFPYLNNFTQNQWNKLLPALYLDFLNESEVGQNKTFLVDKCRDYLISSRKSCDFNYGVTYGGCIVAAFFEGPFVAPLTVLCVSTATTIFVKCYDTAAEQYQICKRIDLN